MDILNPSFNWTDLTDDEQGNPRNSSNDHFLDSENLYKGNVEPSSQIDESTNQYRTTLNEQTTEMCTHQTRNQRRLIIIEKVKRPLCYDNLYNYMSPYGKIERLKINYSFPDNESKVYITFWCSCLAKKAIKALSESNFSDHHPFQYAKLINTIPTMYKEKVYCEEKPKEPQSSKGQKMYPNYYWYITLKENHTNLLYSHQFLERFIGDIEEDQLKRYGRGLLLKAADSSQAMMIPLIKVNQSKCIEKIEPHKTFNHNKGVVYSKDLYELDTK